MAKILMLITMREFFFSSLKKSDEKTFSISPQKVADELCSYGHEVKILHYEDVADTEQFKGWFVLYASSEDIGLFYKDYMEDILLRLQLAQAVLIPRFEHFRSHHNKAFMEGYRQALPDDSLKTIRSYIYPSLEGMRISSQQPDEYPVVVKPSAGAGSQNVILAHNFAELEKAAKQVGYYVYWRKPMRTGWTVREKLAKLVCRFIRRRPPKHYPHTHKFVVQNYIPNLNGDFKVLVFGQKYYVLERKNRSNDFRASGSGKFMFMESAESIQHILEYAHKAYHIFDVPIASLDIAYDGHQCHLVEFQFINFGPYTLQKSSGYFKRENNSWVRVEETPSLEREYAAAMNEYITVNC